MVNFEDDILNVFPIWKNRNYYPRKEDNCGDEPIIVLIYDDHLGDTIIYGNIDLIGNIILESRGLVLSSLHIGLHTGDANFCI